MPSVILGHDTETGQEVRIGDIERRSGLYILGKPGMGKSALLVNMMIQDMKNQHSLFFLDPHGDAITDLIERYKTLRMYTFADLLDPEDETHSFAINPLACRDITSLRERTNTYTRAYNVFYKLWEDSWGPWLQLILQNTLYAFIENQEYTLAEVPMFLNSRNTAFRNHIVDNIKYNQAVADFWRYEFFERRDRDQQERVDATLTRITTLLTHPYVRHIVGQKERIINFDMYLSNNIRRYYLVKLSANLAPDIKKFIGTLFISELLHAVRNRPEDNREQFCVYIDEFQNFASIEDFTTLITEGRKFGVATTIAHQERFGQFAENQKLLGATSAAVNKVFFQLTVKDAEELAPEFAEKPDDTKTRMGGELVVSPHAIEDIWDRGHTDSHMMHIRDKYFWIVDLLKTPPQEDFYVFDRQKIQTAKGNGGNLNYEKFGDWFQYRATPDMVRLGISLLNKYYYDCMQNGFKEQLITNDELELFLEIIDCFSGVYGFRPTFEPFITDDMRERFVRLMKEKQDREILNIKNRIEQGLLSPDLMMHHARQDAWGYSHSPEGKELELWNVIDRENPTLRRKWTLEQIPHYLLSANELYDWGKLGLEVFTQSELPEFIKWGRRDLHSQERKVLAELVKIVSDITLNEEEYEQNQKRIYHQYTAIMVQPLMFLRFGENHNDLPFEKTEPYLRTVTERIVWQLSEMQHFILYCLRFLPSFLARNPIKIQSAQYDETPKREKTQGEMIDIMAQELSNLPRFTAYAKIIEENEGKQSVLKRKIETLPLPPRMKPPIEDGKQWQELDAELIRNSHDRWKTRVEIEEEIRQRQEKWRRIEPQSPGQPPEEPPPPTHF